MLNVEEVTSAKVRVPRVAPGTALRVSQYGTRAKAVVVNPEDFARLQRLEELLDEVSTLEPFQFTALAAELHNSSQEAEDLDRAGLGVALGLE
jgi:hypothetical protein